jgi:hypothetical protein
MSQSKMILSFLGFVAGIVFTIPLFAQASLPQDKYVFIEKIQQVSGTKDIAGILNIDFPLYMVTAGNGLKYYATLDLTASTRLITGGSISISGFGSGTSSELTCYDVLSVDDSFLGQLTAAIDGTVQVLVNGNWLTLLPGESWSETTQSATFMGVTGQFTTKTTIINHGIWDKSNVSAPNLSTPGPSPEPTIVPFLCGDVNGDSRVDIVDALNIARYYIGLTPVSFIAAAADVNGDGSVTIVDALRVAQYYVGIITSLSCSL